MSRTNIERMIDNNTTKQKSKRTHFDEKVWEDYVAKYPKTFLKEDLNLFKRQWQLPSECGKPDLVFERANGELLIVELQLRALDRNHFYKTFEYQREIQSITGKPTKITILCNSLNERKNYLDMHRQNTGIDIDVIVIPEKEVKRLIKKLCPEVIFISSKSKPEIESDSISQQVFAARVQGLQSQINELESALIAEKRRQLPDELLSLVHRKEEYDNELIWRRDLFQTIEKMVEPYQHKTWYGSELRAFCPLCKSGAENIYEGEIGWHLPTGLERHVLHTHDIRHCKITGIAFELVRPYFLKQYKLEAERREEELEQRRIIEDIFLTNPTEKPKLIDEELISYPSHHRSPDELKAAEKRLKELKFNKTRTDSVIKYTRQIDSYTVFADPRAQGRIDFAVFKNKTLKRGMSYKQINKHNRDFYILDNWKNIETTFKKRIAKFIDPELLRF